MELGLLGPPLGMELLEALTGGQHLEASQGASVVGPLGQASMQSYIEIIRAQEDIPPLCLTSVLVMDPFGSEATTNSGWIVVE